MFETIESSERKSQESTEGSESTMPMWVPVAGAICDAVFLLMFLMRPDLGHMSPLMALCLLFALVVGIVGLIGIFKGGKIRAVIAALTGLGLCTIVLLLPLLLVR